MNEVEIVVTGKNQFKPTQTSVVKQIEKLKTAAEEAAKSAEELDKELAKPKTKQADELAKSMEAAGKAVDEVAEKIQRVDAEQQATSKDVSLGERFRAAAAESGAALDELLTMLHRVGTEAGASLYSGLRLDRARAGFASIGRSIEATFPRAAAEVRRLTTLAVTGARAVGDAWNRTTDEIQDALGAAARATMASWMAATAPVRRAKTVALEVGAAITGAFDRAFTQVQARSRAIGDSIAAGFDRALEPARRVGAVVSHGAEMASQAWSRVSDPVIRFGRAVGDVAGETARLSTRVVAPFAKIGAELVDTLGDAGRRGAHALVNGITSVGNRISSAAKSTYDGARKVGTSIVDGIRGPFTAGVDAITAALPKALTSPALMGAIAVAAVPIGAIAGGAIVSGFGAAIAGVGLFAAAQSTEVRNAFSDLKNDLAPEMHAIAAPFEKTWLEIAAQARTSFATFRPALANAFRDLAPDVSTFTDNLFRAFGKLAPALQPLSDAFGAVLGDVGRRLPGVFDGIAKSLVRLSESIERNPQALGRLIEGLGKLTEFTIGDFASLNDGLNAIDEELQMIDNWFHGKGYELDSAVNFNIDDKAGDELHRIADGFAAAKGGAYNTTTAMRDLNAALDDVAKTSTTVADRGRDILQILDILAGRSPTYEESVQGVNDTIRGLIDTFTATNAAADGFGKALINADGTVNTTTENGSKLRDAIVDLQTEFSNMAGATRELEAAGMSHDAAIAKVNSDMLAQRQRLIDNAWQMGLTKDQMIQLLNTYGLNPKVLDTLARLDDAAAKQGILDLQKTGYKTIIVSYQEQINYGGKAHSGSGYSTGYAHGGVSSGGWTTVGELGPERIKLPPGAQVQPYTQSRRELEKTGAPAAGGGAPAAVVIQVQPGGGGLDQLFFDWLRRGVKVRGGNVQVVLGATT